MQGSGAVATATAGECWPVGSRISSARDGCSRRWARCRSWCCGTRAGPGPSRIAARTSASRSTRARSRPACSPATGTTPASTWPAAARSIRGPTTPRGFDVALDGDDVWVAARPDADPVGRLRAPPARRPGARADAGHGQGDARAARADRAAPTRSCAPRSSSALAYRAEGWGSRAHRPRRHGQRAAAPRPGRPRPGPRPRPGLRDPRHAGPPAPVPDRAARPRRRAGRSARASGTAASSRPGRPTPPSGCWRRPSPARRRWPTAEAMHVRRRHRPRVHRRGPHARLHQQGRSRR